MRIAPENSGHKFTLEIGSSGCDGSWENGLPGAMPNQVEQVSCPEDHSVIGKIGTSTGIFCHLLQWHFHNPTPLCLF